MSHKVRKQRPLESVWRGMVSRCRNPKDDRYANYGGRGITVCDRWRAYANFIADMGQRPTPDHQIDRIDSNGPYSPENCRWATRTDQQRNRRTCRYLELDGERMCLSAWAERIGIQPDSLAERLDRFGWSIARALTTPRIVHTKKPPKAKKVTLASLAREKGIPLRTVYTRIYNLGWDREKAINTPQVAWFENRKQP